MLLNQVSVDAGPLYKQKGDEESLGSNPPWTVRLCGFETKTSRILAVSTKSLVPQFRSPCLHSVEFTSVQDFRLSMLDRQGSSGPCWVEGAQVRITLYQKLNAHRLFPVGSWHRMLTLTYEMLRVILPVTRSNQPQATGFVPRKNQMNE